MSIRVLIVEDNAVARSFLTRVVRESFSDEIRFSEASDLDSARQWLGIGPGEQAHAPADGFRLILCDLEQPDKAGLELLAQLADYPAIKIATTLHSDDEHLFPALLCGANGYLLKEDRFEVLVEELQRIVRGQPPLSPAMARRMLGQFRPHDSLSTQENEVLTYLSKGFTIKEIARLMGIKWQAVNDHVRMVYRKLALASSPEEGLQVGRQTDV
ncbi:response regulator transcription factor [Sphaerotilus montanus]|jgi:DNA-binding NarL/FixJ family response regulator|uniref:DNA-binding NarL/FixJ family response regulator n=1 Tax=Sphaerotilus montanus TaxID=522889 RepID=A0A7Y9R244_9BURK|nr:response regulator transcription factor [Sphaerotilus montanus]NYG35358.1 DNA-binding NarL/FixJ family response regulator [Sphaerotilus montanus]NZD58119.1 response regulator transcription factor [Sphaerotilus montanus]